MSARDFSRAYTRATGQTSAKAVETFRIEAACEFLRSTTLSILSIAVRCGFKNDEQMKIVDELDEFYNCQVSNLKPNAG